MSPGPPDALHKARYADTTQSWAPGQRGNLCHDNGLTGLGLTRFVYPANKAHQAIAMETGVILTAECQVRYPRTSHQNIVKIGQDDPTVISVSIVRPSGPLASVSVSNPGLSAACCGSVHQKKRLTENENFDSLLVEKNRRE